MTRISMLSVGQVHCFCRFSSPVMANFLIPSSSPQMDSNSIVQCLAVGASSCFEQLMDEDSRSGNQGKRESHYRGRASMASSPPLPDFLVGVIPINPLIFPLCQTSLKTCTVSLYQGISFLTLLYSSFLSVLLLSCPLLFFPSHLLPLRSPAPLVRGSCPLPTWGTMQSSLGVHLVS